MTTLNNPLSDLPTGELITVLTNGAIDVGFGCCRWSTPG